MIAHTRSPIVIASPKHKWMSGIQISKKRGNSVSQDISVSIFDKTNDKEESEKLNRSMSPIPYIKENVFLRLKKTVDIMVGNTSMRWFPEHYEQKFLEIDESALQAKKNAIKNKGLSSKAIKSTRKIE